MLIFYFTVFVAIGGDKIKIYNQIIILLLISEYKSSIVLPKCYLDFYLSWFVLYPEDNRRF